MYIRNRLYTGVLLVFEWHKKRTTDLLEGPQELKDRLAERESTFIQLVIEMWSILFKYMPLEAKIKLQVKPPDRMSLRVPDRLKLPKE